MRKAGIIKKYTVIVNEGTLRSRVSCYMFINVKHGTAPNVSKQLVANEHVSLVQEVHGPNDIIAKIEALDLEKLRNIIVMIQKNPAILESKCLTVFKRWKE